MEKPLYTLDDPETDAEEPVSPDNPEPPKPSRPSAIALMIKILLTPIEGWKALRRARLKTDDVAASCFYPLLALAALSKFSLFFYEANMTLADVAKAGLVAFVTFFFGYFLVLFFAGFLLPRQSREALKNEFGKQFVLMSMSTYVLFYILMVLLPMLDPVLVFLPGWTIYCIYRGVRFLRVPKEKESATIGIMCLLVIGCPILCNWIFTEILL